MPGSHGVSPLLGPNEQLQTDPAFRDNVPFHKYSHGDTSQGLGAMHQTGWTSLVALLMAPRSKA